MSPQVPGLAKDVTTNFNTSNIYNGNDLAVAFENGTSYTANYTARYLWWRQSACKRLEAILILSW